MKYLPKLEKLIFYALVFSIPFQTRVILRSWGVGFNEWNAAFLYWTDLLIIALFVFWFLRIRVFYDIAKSVRIRIRNITFSNYDWLLITFLAISAISIKNAINPELGFFRLLKLAEFSLLYFYIKSGFGLENLKTAFGVFFVSGFFQAILGIGQYLKQGDFGLRFLGETVLSPDLFNVAIFLVDGEKVMRAYGTTPHPNVLAFFLFVAIFIYYFFYIGRSKFAASSTGLILYFFLLFGFFSTFSRIIIFVWLAAVLIELQLYGGRRIIEVRKLILTTIFVILLFSVLFWPQVLARLEISPQDEAVAVRGFYSRVSFLDKPFFGVGLGNFVNWLREANPGLTSNLYQPVHNIYLLIFSETGILGLVMFLLFLIFLIKNSLTRFSDTILLSTYYLLLSGLLFFGLFDHFLLTLQQGSLIFWLVLGLTGVLSSSNLHNLKRRQE